MNTYKQRADHLSNQRAALMRAADHATTLAESAQRRKDRAAVVECLDLLEALRDALGTLTALMADLRDELTTHQPTKKETPQ